MSLQDVSGGRRDSHSLRARWWRAQCSLRLKAFGQYLQTWRRLGWAGSVVRALKLMVDIGGVDSAIITIGAIENNKNDVPELGKCNREVLEERGVRAIVERVEFSFRGRMPPQQPPDIGFPQNPTGRHWASWACLLSLTKSIGH